MRALRGIALAAGMFGGLLGVGMTAEAAPMPAAAAMAEQAAPAPTVQKAYYYGRRFYGRPFYRRRFFY